MKRLTVEIISSKATYWYALRVGQTFDVYRWADGYVVAEDLEQEAKVWRHFAAEDVRIISEG
jgi:hypothetical protein